MDKTDFFDCKSAEMLKEDFKKISVLKTLIFGMLLSKMIVYEMLGSGDSFTKKLSAENFYFTVLFIQKQLFRIDLVKKKILSLKRAFEA